MGILLIPSWAIRLLLRLETLWRPLLPHQSSAAHREMTGTTFKPLMQEVELLRFSWSRRLYSWTVLSRKSLVS